MAKTTSGPKRSYRSVVAIAGLVLAAAAGMLYLRSDRFGPSGYAPGSLEGFNVVLITLDTTRADRLPAYGYTKVKTPGLDRIAASGLVFEDAIAHVPLTLPAHASILTGQLPIGHGVRDNEGFRLDPKIETISSNLKRNGYVTAAFVSAFVLDARWGLNQGFDFYFDDLDVYQSVNRNEVQRRAEDTVSEVEKWLPANKDRRFFCWVHFFDPHDPYDPPEPYASMYPQARYDGEIAYMDQSIGRLLQALDDLGLSNRTLIVVTGDHGEGLGEHDELTHGMFLYRTTQHVPLLIRAPGGKPRRIPGIVRHIDLAPTILDLLGLEPVAAMHGESLVPMINGTEKTGRTAYAESLYAQYHYGWSAQTSLTTSRYDFIQSPKAELFDRRDDPGQVRNLIQERESVAQDLAEQLNVLVAQYTRKDLEGPKAMDSDTEEKLRSLGYLGSPVAATAESSKTDPKDKRRLVGDMHEAAKALALGEFETALRLALSVAEADPNIVDAHLIAGSAFVNLKQYDRGADELFKVLASRPDHTMALATLGTAYEGMGKLEEAERWYLKVLAVENEHGYTLVKLAGLYRRLNQPEKADEFLARATPSPGGSPGAAEDATARSRQHAIQAELSFGAGRFAEARQNLTEAIALTPRDPSLHFNLAQVYERMGDIPNAIANYQKETEIAPTNLGAYLNMGLLQLQTGRAEDGATTFKRLLAVSPGDPRASFLLAESYNLLNTNLEEALQLTRQGLTQMPDNQRGRELLAEIQKKLGRL